LLHIEVACFHSFCLPFRSLHCFNRCTAIVLADERAPLWQWPLYDSLGHGKLSHRPVLTKSHTSSTPARWSAHLPQPRIDSLLSSVALTWPYPTYNTVCFSPELTCITSSGVRARSFITPKCCDNPPQTHQSPCRDMLRSCGSGIS
jgi:hypothetical protein